MADRFTIVKRGYDPAEVNNYIENLELVIKGYKEKDAAINNALVSAQITAGNIIKEANANAADIKSAVVEKLDTISDSVVEQKRMVKEFQDDYNRLVSKYLREVNQSEIMSLHARINELEDFISGLSADGPPERE